MSQKTMDEREELRRRLREKIRGKRDSGGGGPQLAQRLREDPTTAMLQMGLDDPNMLKNARNIVKRPQEFLRAATEGVCVAAADNTKEEATKQDTDDDDEEAPPS